MMRLKDNGRRYASWDDVFRHYVGKDFDHGYAAVKADEWEKRSPLFGTGDSLIPSDDTQNFSCDYCGTEFQYTAQEVYGGLQCRCETWVSWRDEDGNPVELIPVDGGKFVASGPGGGQ